MSMLYVFLKLLRLILGFSDNAALFFVKKHGIVHIMATTNTESGRCVSFEAC